MQELLPVKYYHVVFTLPHELNSLVPGHRKLLFKLFFDASSQTLLTFAKDPKYLAANTWHYQRIAYLGAAAELSSSCPPRR
jgi:hypothetical protein